MEEKMEQLLEIVPTFNYIIMSEEELEHIKIDNDLVKGLHSNYKRYAKLKENINPILKNDFFDICHILGYFSKSGIELDYIEYTIKYLYATCSEADINLFISNITDLHYVNKYANILLSAIGDGKFKDNILFYSRIFNHFKTFSKHIEKINKNRIKAITNRGLSLPGDDEKLKKVKNTGKTIILEDVKDYKEKVDLINAYPFLKPYYQIFLLETYDASELRNIIDFYLYALENTQNDELYFKNLVMEFDDKNVKWLASCDPFNLALGYLLKVCSTFSGSGSKIMIDGILDPNNKHVVITNKDNQLEAKATVVFHEKYIFCGPLTFTDSITDNLTYDQEKDYYYKYLSSIKKQYELMKERGIVVDEFRIATDESMISNALKGRSDSNEFRELLSKCSFYWSEMDDKLFDHKPPQYKLVRGL